MIAPPWLGRLRGLLDGLSVPGRRHARCHETLGDLRERAGDDKRARAARAAAAAIYHDLGLLGASA